MQPKRKRPLVVRLLRVGPDDFEIRAVLQREQVVVDPAPLEAPAQFGADARRRLDFGDRRLHILSRQHDVIDHLGAAFPCAASNAACAFARSSLSVSHSNAVIVIARAARSVAACASSVAAATVNCGV